MKTRKLVIFLFLFVIIYTFYKINDNSCKSCKGDFLRLLWWCQPNNSIYDITYNRLNCFLR
jgi:hypothetical protein